MARYGYVVDPPVGCALLTVHAHVPQAASTGSYGSTASVNVGNANIA